MKKILLSMLIFLTVTAYAQQPTRGALSTLDTTVNKPTIKMLAVNPLDNAVVFWNLSYWATVSIGASGVTSVGLSVPSVGSPFLGVSGTPVTTSGTLALSALGTSSQIVLGNGALSSSLPSGLIPTLQQTLTAGSTLTGNNTISGGGFDFIFNNADEIKLGSNTAAIIDINNPTNIIQIGDVGAVFQSTLFTVDGTDGSGKFTADNSNHDTKFGINTTSPDSALKVIGGIFGTRGLRLSSLTNLSTQNRLLGQFGTDGNVGYITLAGSLSLSSGVLTGTGITGLTVGTTTIASGTTTRILYDNAGVLGEYTITGSGTVVAMQTSPSFVTSVIGGASFDVFNTTSTTINAFGAATTLNIAANASGAAISLGGSTNPIELRFKEGSGGGSNYVGFKANATLAGNTIYTLPTAFPAGNDYLFNSSTSGVIGFTDPTSLAYWKLAGTNTLTADVNNTGFNVGFGVPTPLAQVHTTSFAAEIKIVEDDGYDITETDFTLSVFNGASNWTIYLPDATTCQGRIYIIKRQDETCTGTITVQDIAANNVQIPTTLAFASSFTLGAIGTFTQSVMVQSNGLKWETIK